MMMIINTIIITIINATIEVIVVAIFHLEEDLPGLERLHIHMGAVHLMMMMIMMIIKMIMMILIIMLNRMMMTIMKNSPRHHLCLELLSLARVVTPPTG